MAKAEKKDAFFDAIPVPGSTAAQRLSTFAYHVVVWVYQDGEKIVAEAPQLGLKSSQLNGKDALTGLSGQITTLRNNGGKPKPLVLKDISGLEVPEGAQARRFSVS